MLRRSNAENAYLKSLFGNKLDRAAGLSLLAPQNGSCVMPLRGTASVPYEALMLAPPKRSFQRGMTSRL